MASEIAIVLQNCKIIIWNEYDGVYRRVLETFNLSTSMRVALHNDESADVCFQAILLDIGNGKIMIDASTSPIPFPSKCRQFTSTKSHFDSEK